MRLSILFALAPTLAACATVAAPPSSAPGPQPIEVMVLGTWHFAGSDSDLISARTDSVLSPRRQAELEIIAKRLAAFRPTLVVTERVTAAPDYVDPHFAAFSPDALATNENERVQVAYRLAAKAGVDRVVGLDEQAAEGEPDYFPFGRVAAHAAQTGQGEALDGLIADVQKRIGEETARLSTLPMAQALIEANRGPLSSSEFYFELLKLDVGEAQPAAELNAYWFMRNAKIVSKLLDVSKPGDRVVVVFGAGHKFWLEQIVDATPGLALIDPVAYLGAPR